MYVVLLSIDAAQSLCFANTEQHAYKVAAKAMRDNFFADAEDCRFITPDLLKKWGKTREEVYEDDRLLVEAFTARYGPDEFVTVERVKPTVRADDYDLNWTHLSY